MSVSVASGALVIQDGSPADVPAALRPWVSAPPGAVSFGPADGLGAVEPIWRVELPADVTVAAEILRAGAGALDDVERAEPLALERLLRATLSVSFATAGNQPTPEANLGAALAEVDQATRVGAVDFAFGGLPMTAWHHAYAAFTAAMGHLRRLVSGRSWVDTLQEGRLVGRTSLGRTGDQATAWAMRVSEAETRLHLRAVALALRSRAALMRTFGLAMRGAALLAAAASGPAGVLLALPVAWTFVDDVMAEVGMARTRHEEVSHAG